MRDAFKGVRMRFGILRCMTRKMTWDGLFPLFIYLIEHDIYGLFS